MTLRAFDNLPRAGAVSLTLNLGESLDAQELGGVHV